VDAEIQENLREPVADGEDEKSFVIARLKLRCFELFQQVPEGTREALLATVDELMVADGKSHPSEVAFRAELAKLLEEPIEFDDAEIETLEEGAVVIGASVAVPPAAENHPF